jgi:nitrate/TMAO reductase-like tetraheme cytochrome c subunit
MMNKWLMIPVSLLLIEIVGMCLVVPTESAKAKKEMAKVVKKHKSCSACHDDFTILLSAKHPPVKGNTLRVCMKCHAQEGKDMAKPNKFEARLHLAHLKSPVKADCLDCHTWQPGKSFGLAGTTVSYGAPSRQDMILIKEIFASAIQSDNLDARHVSKAFTCAACHGKDMIGESAVENTQCLGCHGPFEELIAKTAPQDFPDRNPHKSHLGEISCTVCHAGHARSKVYCLECHPKFAIKLPGS